MIKPSRWFLVACVLVLPWVVVRAQAQTQAPAAEEFPVFRALERLAADPGEKKFNRLASINGLGQATHPTVVPALTALLADPDAEIRSAAATALGWAGNRAAIEPLLARATDAAEAPPVSAKAIEALGEIGDASVAPAVEGLARNPNAMVRREALLVLIQSPVGARVDRVAAGLSLLQDLEQDGFARAAGAVALGAAKDARAVEPLITVLKDPRPPKGYAELPSPERQTGQAKVLAERLRSLHNVRAHAAAVLGQLEDQRAVPALLGALSDADPFVRLESVAALGRLKPRGAVADLSKVLHDPDTRVRLMAVVVLGRQGDPTAGPVLRQVLSDPEPGVRGQAALALGLLGDRDAREPLGKMAEEDPDPTAQQSARTALERLGRLPAPKP